MAVGRSTNCLVLIFIWFLYGVNLKPETSNFHHMQDNHGEDMYAIERVPMGRFDAE